MKKLFFSKKTAYTLLVITLAVLGIYAYMLVRPISYGMEYCIKENISGYEYESTTVFHSGNKMTLINLNFEEPQELYYYYKDGWYFSCMAQTEDEYKVEVEQIDANFEEAVATPFYASKINAFSYSYEDFLNGGEIVHTCNSAIVFAIVGGVAVIGFIALTVITFAVGVKKNKENN